MTTRNNSTGLLRKALSLGVMLAFGALGTVSAFAQTSYSATTYAGTTASGTQITNTASVSYTIGTVTGLTGQSNTVSVYVNQIDVFYITPNDTVISVVPATQDKVTVAKVAASFSYSVVNLSNGPITVTLSIGSSNLTPVISGTTLVTDGSTSYYGFSATGGTLSGTTPGSTLSIAKGGTAALTVTVTPPSGAAAGGWDLFALKLADATTTATLTAAGVSNPTLVGIEQYSSTGNSTLWTANGYAGKDIQASAEVDIVSGLLVGKLQLLDTGCAGTGNFSTTSVTTGTRTLTSAIFPTSFVATNWTSGVLSAVSNGAGLNPVSAFPGECVAYQIVLFNPLSVAAAGGATVTDTVASTLTLLGATPAKTAPSITVNGNTVSGTGTIPTSVVLPSTNINGGSYAVVQYEVKVTQ